MRQPCLQRLPSDPVVHVGYFSFMLHVFGQSHHTLALTPQPNSN